MGFSVLGSGHFTGRVMTKVLWKVGEKGRFLILNLGSFDAGGKKGRIWEKRVVWSRGGDDRSQWQSPWGQAKS